MGNLQHPLPCFNCNVCETSRLEGHVAIKDMFFDDVSSAELKFSLLFSCDDIL